LQTNSKVQIYKVNIQRFAFSVTFSSSLNIFFIEMHFCFEACVQARAIDHSVCVVVPVPQLNSTLYRKRKGDFLLLCVIKWRRDILHPHSSFRPGFCRHIFQFIRWLSSKFFILPLSLWQLWGVLTFVWLLIGRFIVGEQKHVRRRHATGESSGSNNVLQIFDSPC